MLTTILVTVGLFGFFMAIMAVGVIFSGKCLRGSCGGSEEVIGPDGEPIRCATCPRRHEENHVCDGKGPHDDDEELVEPLAAAPSRPNR